MTLCEVCADHGRQERGPLYRVAIRWGVRVAMRLCKRHAKALKRSTLASEVRILSAAPTRPIVRKTFKHENGHEAWIEVQ